MTRDADIARIAALLRAEAVAFVLHAYSHTPEQQAEALYGAGLRLLADSPSVEPAGMAPTNEYGAYLDERLAACRERPSLAAFEALAVDAISFALDHPYETEADSYMCLHCGDTGSYAHTAEAQREWRASRRLLPTQASDSPEKP